MNRRKTPEATGERISIGHGEESDEGVRTFKHVLAELSVNDKQEHRDVVFHTLLHPTGFPGDQNHPPSDPPPTSSSL